MNTKWLFGAIVLAACVWTSGCVTSVDGRRHVGMPLVKDRVEGQYERTQLEAWTAAKDVLAYNGQLYGEDVLKSTLEASVNDRTVWVRIEPLDEKITRVVVQTRTKTGTPDLELAGEIDKQIAIRLATGNLSPATRAAAPKRR
jgi:hypothetical protein